MREKSKYHDAVPAAAAQYDAVFAINRLIDGIEIWKRQDDIMYGAILGDIIGSPFEFDRGEKTKNFVLFSPGAEFTDDTVMTIAVAEALLDAGIDAEEVQIKEQLSIGSGICHRNRTLIQAFPGINL